MKKRVAVGLITVLIVAAVSAQAILPAPVYTISGTVVDDPYPSKRMSLPIAGARVYLEQMIDCIDCAVPYAQRQEAVAPIFWPGYYTIIDSALTNTSGGFSFGDQPAGSYRLNASHADFKSRDVDLYVQADTSVTIMLLEANASATVSGVVTQNVGMLTVFIPVANCTVTVYSYEDNIIPLSGTANTGMPISIMPLAYTAVTDRNGEYTITGIPLSRNGQGVSATAGRSGYQTKTVDTTLWNNMTTTVNFSLTVSSTSVKPAVQQLAPTSTATYSARDRRLSIQLDHGQYVNVEAYLLNGEKVKQLSSRRFLAAGTHSYSLSASRMNAQIAVLKITGDSFSVTRTIELTAR